MNVNQRQIFDFLKKACLHIDNFCNKYWQTYTKTGTNRSVFPRKKKLFDPVFSKT